MNDYEECMKILTKYDNKIKYVSRINGDMFECGLTEFFTSLISSEALKLIREEFVSWLDVLVGTRREMLDLGIDVKEVDTIRHYLNFFKEKVTCLQTVKCDHLKELCS